MSGGAFNYDQYKIHNIACEIESAITENCASGEARFSDETIAEFRTAVKVLAQALVYADRIDWLLSGDDGEESFHRRLHEELKHDTDDILYLSEEQVDIVVATLAAK